MPGAPQRARTLDRIGQQLDRAQDRNNDRRRTNGARPAPPPVTNQPRPARAPAEPRANSGLTPEQTIRHIALTHTTHYYRDSESLPSTDDVLKTAAQFAAWIKNGEA
jgi:hypothetical protein